MNLINHLLILLSVIILIGCNTNISKTVETRIIDQDEEISNQDEEISNQEIKEDFKLTDDNVIDFLFEYEKNNKEDKIRIYTNYGDIDILLFSNTPYHRSNFIFLTKTNYFEGTQKPVNEYITLDQFMTIRWKCGVAQFFIHLLSTMTGQADAVKGLFQRLMPHMNYLI